MNTISMNRSFHAIPLFWYVAWISFMLTCVTGIVCAWYFSPHLQQAEWSIEYIKMQTFCGILVSYMHRIFMVLCVSSMLLHSLFLFVSKEKRPLFISSVVLLLVAIGASMLLTITGFVLHGGEIQKKLVSQIVSRAVERGALPSLVDPAAIFFSRVFLLHVSVLTGGLIICLFIYDKIFSVNYTRDTKLSGLVQSVLCIMVLVFCFGTALVLTCVHSFGDHSFREPIPFLGKVMSILLSTIAW